MYCCSVINVTLLTGKANQLYKKNSVDAAHLHLLLNHFPVIGTVFGILTLIAGLLLRNDGVKSAAFGIFVFTALISVPAFLSGEPAEEAIEHLAGIDENYIEKHEELAGVAIWFVAAVGVLSLIALVMRIRGGRYVKPLSYLTLLISLVTFGMMARVNNSGGEIRHPEIRSGTLTASPPAQENEKDED